MAYANILVRNVKPKPSSDSIALDSIISFELVPYNGDIIDLMTLSIKIEISSSGQSKRYYLLDKDSPQIKWTGDNTTGFRIKIDMFPNSDLKFDEKSNIILTINVNNSNTLKMRQERIIYNTVRLDQLDALMDLLSEVMEVTVDRELGRIENETTVSFTWDNWSTVEDPKIFLNDVLLESGYTVDRQKGIVTFDSPLRINNPIDRVEADYKHGVFSQAQLINFMEIGMAEFNAQPRQSNFTIKNAPAYAQAAVILGGAYYAICAILMGLINQQSRVRWGDENTWDKVQGILTTLKENYKSSVTKIYESKKLRLAQPAAIVVPEWTLPGGRSRFFRYLYKEGGSM